MHPTSASYNIIDPVINALHDGGISCIGLLGTDLTMEHPLFPSTLQQNDIECLVPSAHQRKIISSIIYDELCAGLTPEASKNKYFSIIEDLQSRGAQGIILGCTEICLIVNETELGLPCFDVTHLHAMEILHKALSSKRPARYLDAI